MFIKKFIYVNWGNIPNTEFEFGPINLFSGGNGSGKTTAADAIQTIMTAAHDNLFHFNPGQDESTQRGRGGKVVRTLASYVLGCDDGAYARPYPCEGYLAAVFSPTEGETAETFTAVIAMRAFLESSANKKVARLDDCLFYILPGEALSLNDFVQSDSGGEYVVGTDRIFALLRKKFGQQSVEKYDRKKTYLSRLYGALRGRQDAVSEREALHAARAFSRFMAYKPVKSINEFVATEILEQKDLGEAIRDVSAMLKRIHGMENDARQLKNSIELLEQANQYALSYVSQWMEWQLLYYTEARCRYMQDQQGYLHAKRAQDELHKALEGNHSERQLADTRRQEIRSQLRLLEAKRMGIPALRDKDQLETDKEQVQASVTRQAPELMQEHEKLQCNIEVCQTIQALCQKTSLSVSLPALENKDLKRQAKDILAAKKLGQIDFHSLFTRDWIDISPLEHHLDEVIRLQTLHNVWVGQWLTPVQPGAISLRDAVVREYDKREERVTHIARQVERKQSEIESLRSRQISYPAHVRSALEAIRKQIPQADARVLCDYVEVIDSQWQSAIEGYVGGARFGIIVEQEYEAEAIRLVRALSGKENRARVIQGAKAGEDAARLSLPENSVLHVMEFSHVTAEHYLKASYGSVERVDSAEQLRHTRRGLTKDSMGSGNYAMFRCDISDSDLVFGQQARERAEAAKREELSTLESEWQQTAQARDEVAELQQQIERLGFLSYADTLQSMLQEQRKLRTIENQLQQLDLTDFKHLNEELDLLRQQESEQDEKITSLDNSKGELSTRLKQSVAQCQKLADIQEQTQLDVEACEQNIRKIHTVRSEFDLENQLNAADQRASDMPLKTLQAELDGFTGLLGSHFHNLQKSVMAHNQHCIMADSIPFDPDYSREHSLAFFKTVCQAERQIDAVHNRIKNNILAIKHSELAALKKSFNNTFVMNLCHSIYQSINEGERTLEDLNRELEHHRFGADRERFYFEAQWVAEFKEYWQFFKSVIDSPLLGDGQTLFDMKLSDKQTKVRDRLIAMLLDDDEARALRELERISDYRNYRSYEIYKEPLNKAPIALSQYGTGSGGQLETPAYIIRSAAITSAFRFNDGNSHLRMVLVDEAFSKMDEHRSKEVINYLTEALGLQLLFIMPTSKSGPFMDLISHQFVFSKCPVATQVDASNELTTQVLVDRQQCNQDKIQQLWANHRQVIRQQATLDFMEAFAD